MKKFLRELVHDETFELLIDTSLFSEEIIMNAAFNLQNLGYFSFQKNEDARMILSFTRKSGVKLPAKEILGRYNNQLLEVALRDKVEKQNKTIREAIVLKALTGPLDSQNFVSFDSDEIVQDVAGGKNSSNSPKKKSKNTATKLKKPQISTNTKALKNAKKQFTQ